MYIPKIGHEEKALTSKDFKAAYRAAAGENYQDEQILIPNGANGINAWIMPQAIWNTKDEELYPIGYSVGFSTGCEIYNTICLATTRNESAPRIFKTLDAAVEYWCSAGAEDVRVYTCY